jgi:hypothetical protein
LPWSSPSAERLLSGQFRKKNHQEIRRQLAEAIATSEITAAPGPITEKIVEGDGSELDLRLSKMGYRYYGIFANDPGALELFDEIERQRPGSVYGITN